jgi:hypothetical protein
LSGSKAIEPFDEGPRIAGIGAAKWPVRDALAVVRCEMVGAGLFEPFDEGPRIAGIGAAKWPVRDVLAVALQRIHRAGVFGVHVS